MSVRVKAGPVAGCDVSKPPVRPETEQVAPLSWLTPIRCTTTAKSSGQDRADSVITNWRRKSVERRVVAAAAAG